MDRGNVAGDRGIGRHRPHHRRTGLARRAAVAATGAQRLLRRECSLAGRVGTTARHRQHLRPARRSGTRPGSGYGDDDRAISLGGDAPRYSRCRESAAGADIAADGPGIPAEVIMPSTIHIPTRRDLLLGSGALFAWAYLPGVAQAEGRDPRFLVIILRGALDGLATVAPVGDRDWIRLRGDKALTTDGANAALALDGFFALNPAMPNVHRLYHAGQAAFVHAAATSYRERSHFDGQD